MPSGESNNITQTISNIARAATTRRRHSTSIPPTTLPIPEPPQHTNVTRRNRASVDVYGHLLPEDKRNSQLIEEMKNSLHIEFEGGAHVIVRPNRIVRGQVILKAIERLYATKLVIKFRAEEVATVKVNELTGDGKSSDRVHKVITTFFRTEYRLWGNEAPAYGHAGWDEIEPGNYEFPFALKFPNVNYPPSIEEPKGFHIRYIWTAQLIGAGLESGIKSSEYYTPYRPLLVCAKDRETVYKTTVYTKDKLKPVAKVEARLLKQCYCPDDPFFMHLKIVLLQTDAKMTDVTYRFRKMHEGKMILVSGTAVSDYMRIIAGGRCPVDESGSHYATDIAFTIPTRLVSPSFTTTHTRVHYDLLFNVTCETKGLFKTTHEIEFSVPVMIGNLKHEQMLCVNGLTSIGHYRHNKDLPMFFDHNLEEPPELVTNEGDQEEQPLTSTPREEPPNYFSIPTIPPQLELRRQREETVVYLTSSAKGCDLPEATMFYSLFDENW
ncbi:hypothetical protein G6F46_011313 [Rhizopus delemar]|uniref:Arrestin-like N-terminal domain-containing protein n=2 Tax=Rhizopus TaxID=4842 RepID=A0A9P6YUL2_9FUNG|nr:hypothetical protein G6F55_009378 [Rhizopus delemar]KAG1535678.1 hypothetical protein G6F51_011405 [Rhizopus arrhizus]KAG1489984.1 hypothetical protein G6F54_011050 [Rhizopus delemar]KAG1500913.1 hypothetical protein G6F53_011203 [Rhizopus delemar]KAG1518181.1 hypothetical protein G6F52_009080 [Rhizopus delemar]